MAIRPRPYRELIRALMKLGPTWVDQSGAQDPNASTHARHFWHGYNRQPRDWRLQATGTGAGAAFAAGRVVRDIHQRHDEVIPPRQAMLRGFGR